MAYSNKYSGRSYNGSGRSSYGSGRSYGGSGYNRYQNNGYAQTAPKKHSGASFKTVENGVIVSAWNASREKGLIKVYARPYSKTKVTESKSGKRWANLFVTITFLKTGQIINTSSLLDIDGKRLYVKELGMIATKAGRGGYFGQGGFKAKY